MKIIHTISNDLLHVIFEEWLTFKDLSNLDCAFLEANYRPDFLSTLNKVVQSNQADQISIIKTSFTPELCKWVALRGVALRHLIITSSNFQTLLTFPLKLDWVEHVTINNFLSSREESNLTQTVIRRMVNECKVLLGFDFVSQCRSDNDCDLELIFEISPPLLQQITNLAMQTNDKVYKQLTNCFGNLVSIELTLVDTDTLCDIISNNPALADITVKLTLTESRNLLLSYLTLSNIRLRRLQVKNYIVVEEDTVRRIVAFLHRFNGSLQNFNLWGVVQLETNTVNKSKQLKLFNGICAGNSSVDACDVVRAVPDVTHLTLYIRQEEHVVTLLAAAASYYNFSLVELTVADLWMLSCAIYAPPVYMCPVLKLCVNLRVVRILFCATSDHSPPVFYDLLSKQHSNIEWLSSETE